MLPSLILTPLLALAPVWSSKEIYVSWKNQGTGSEYIWEASLDYNFESICLSTPPLYVNYAYVLITQTNKYYHRVKYHLIGTDTYEYVRLGQFYINLEYGIYSEDYVTLPPPPKEEEEVQDIPIETEPDTTPLPDIPKPLVSTTPVKEFLYTLPPKLDYRESVTSEMILPEVLGASSKIERGCNISLLRKESTTYVTSFRCNIDLHISKVKYLDWGKYLTLDIEGTYPQNVNAYIKVYECKKFSLLDPSTWYGCKEILVDTYMGDIKLTYSGDTYVNGTVQKSNNFGFLNTSFYIRNIFSKDILPLKYVQIYFNIYAQVKGREWIDIIYRIKKDIEIPKVEKIESSKPFNFPLDRIMGVTQWHGCTAYQCPHKGIDFGARLNRVLSIGEGKVVNVGYDRYGGECNQGGKYVIVKHTNGMYSAYIHLASYSVKVGDTLKKGSLIGISGNTGMKNCQPLGYHLHFETRKGLKSATHVNPVPYINVDWNSIHTIGYRQFPGRLSGDNPHPNF